MHQILIVIGTRPEAIKLAPLVLKMRSSHSIHPLVCSTGQHKEMLHLALRDFDITPDFDLHLMQKNQSLGELSSRLFHALSELIQKIRPARIVVQGDTSTAMAAAMCGFFSQIPVDHIEAGLRSGDMHAPFPEELNRRVISLAASEHFAPTQQAAENLLKEGISAQHIEITGNTVVDALLYMRQKVQNAPPSLPQKIEQVLRQNAPYVLITGHRRENWGQGLLNICTAISQLAQEFPSHFFIYPVHLNPKITKLVREQLQQVPNVILCSPRPYNAFIYLLDGCELVLSDSGGVQEEGASLKKHVLVMRETTERPEGVTSGFCHILGTSVDTLVSTARQFLHNTHPVSTMKDNPFGDGLASQRIVHKLETLLTR